MKHLKKVSVVKANIVNDILDIVQGAVEDIIALVKDKEATS